MLWITAALLVCSAESRRYLQPTPQDSYQSPAAENAYRLENEYNRQLNDEEMAVFALGIGACISNQPDGSKKYISSKFFYNHMCLIGTKKKKRKEPDDIAGLCRDFRDERKSTIMVLTSHELTGLSNDIKGHQGDYGPKLDNDKKVFFYTNSKYDFVHCDLGCDNTAGKAQWYRNSYGQYSVQKDANGVYQIYHGCRPASNRPAFFTQNNYC